jgi:hypothetical protein
MCIKKYLRALPAAVLCLSFATSAFAAPWKFAIVCDSRSAYFNDTFTGHENYFDSTTNISPYFQAVANALAANSTGLDLILFPGDLAAGKKLGPVSHNASPAELQSNLNYWNNQWQPVINTGIPVYSVRGNHETTTSLTAPGNSTGADIWRNTIALPAGTTVDTNGAGTATDAHGLTYSFTHKGVTFIGLDEYATGSGIAYDQAFLQQELARPAARKFVFAHQPLFNFKADELGPAGLLADLNTGRADLYMSGHVHSYQRITKDGIRFQEEIVGTGGAPQDNPTLVAGDPGYVADSTIHVQNYTGGALTNAKFGWVEVTVNDDNSITTQLKYLDGSFGDASTNYLFTPDGGVATFDAVNVTPAPTDISGSVKVTTSGLTYSRATQIYSGTLTVTNTGASDINGPIAVTLNNLTSGVTLMNATGTNNGYPLVWKVATLSPGASIQLPVQFRNPSNVLIHYEPSVALQ